MKILENWEDIPCSWIRRIHVVKMTILQKSIYRFSATPVKPPFHSTDKTTIKLMWNHKGPQIAKILIKKIIAGGCYNSRS